MARFLHYRECMETATAAAQKNTSGIPSGYVRICYCSGSGETSTRTIRIRNVYRSRYGKTYIRAYCELRREERTFRLDRILWWEPIHSQTAGEEKRTYRTPYQPKPAAGYSSHTTAASPTTKQKSRKGGGFFIFLTCIAGLIFIVKHEEIIPLLEDLAGYEKTIPDYEFIYTSLVPEPEPAPAPQEPEPVSPEPPSPNPQPAPEPEPTPEEALYTRHINRLAVRFTEITGIDHRGLFEWYRAADGDRDALLSWQEIQNFQNELYYSYRYINNDAALDPVQFVNAGGGDCEDFALMTAGLVRFWGGQPYIASFAPEVHGSGHAICLVYSDTLPDFGMYYQFDEPTYLHGGGTVPDGYYIPVDYDNVGGISNAMRKSWILRALYVPEEIYGNYM